MKRIKLKKKQLDLLKKYPIYSQDGIENKRILMKFFLPGTSWTWYVTEGDIVPEETKNPENIKDIQFFGLVINGYGESEYGYFNLSQLESASVGIFHPQLDEHYSDGNDIEALRKYLKTLDIEI